MQVRSYKKILNESKIKIYSISVKKLLLILLCLPLIGFGQNVNIPDANFKAYLVGNTAINTNGDSEIQVSEATNFTGDITLVAGNPVYYSDLTGIKVFINLTSLDCGGNYITNLDVSQNTALTELECRSNQLTSLDLSNNTALTELRCSFNQLTSLDLSNNTELEILFCSNNLLSNLDLSQNINLKTLWCMENQITDIIFSNNNSDLEYLSCDDNNIKSLDLSYKPNLNSLYCSNNQLECLDLSSNTSLETIFLDNNNLEQLNVQNGVWMTGNMLIEGYNNNLTCVEVDNIGFANNMWASSFDNSIIFSTNCNYVPCNTTSAIQELTTNKELLRTIDVLGRETKNNPIFYIYDDGTVEKRIVIE